MIHSNPNVAAICIHNFRFSGITFANIPESRSGIPKRDGKYEVIEFESEIWEIAIPQIIRKPPYDIVIVGIDCPATVYCVFMIILEITR